jgi:ppGpp synthetase/RelA/SpoT-type nucleotidyltranferase
MMDREEVIKEYRRRSPLFNELEKVSSRRLQSLIDRNNLRIHLLMKRVKPLDSFLEKVRTRGAEDPFSEITDLVGLRVICFFKDDVEKIKGIVRDAFEVIKEDDKPGKTPVESFGYSAPHFDVRLPEGVGRDEIGRLAFEIQIRTICQEAWASISHLLVYKRRIEVAGSVKRDFYALNALFYVADTHFDMLKSTVKEAAV